MLRRIRSRVSKSVLVLAIAAVSAAPAQTGPAGSPTGDAVTTPAGIAANAPSPAPASPASPTASAPGEVTRAFDRYVLQGGWVTIFTLIPLSVAGLALMIQYLLQIRRSLIVPESLIRELRGQVDAAKYAEALQIAHDNPCTISEVLQAGFFAAREGLVAMERAMEDSLEECAGRFQRKIEHLNLIGSVAPMIGLFGTVNGIIGMFGSISESGGVPVMSRISADLGSALVATFWGLFIAIPSLTVFGILRNRVDVLMQECAVAAESLTAKFRAPASAGGPESIVAPPPPTPRATARARIPAKARTDA